jgi:hypothetical protein
MPGGDFPGYAAELQVVRDALVEHGRVPRWCVECYGGSSRFTSHAKEYLAFPLALATDPITATKLTWVLLRVVSALGLYAWAVRTLGWPPLGIVAGYAYAFGAVPSSQAANLDMALAAALLPFFWIALLEHFRRGQRVWTLGLAALTALLFASNWVYAFTTPFAAGMVLALRPWPGRRLAPGWVARSAAALGLFATFSASQLAWLAADSAHHWLGEDPAMQRNFYVERSPFLFVNRAGWLADWLAEHQPPGFDLPALRDGDGRYLGAAVLGVSGLGAALAPAGSGLPRLAGAAAALFLLQYWLALGPRTLLREVAESFGVGEAGQAAVGLGLTVAAALCAAGAGLLAWRRVRGAAALAVAGLLLSFPTVSLWNALSGLPPLSVQRSPGHFFDTAYFWLCLCFASGLAALVARLATRARRVALVAAVGTALVLDFAPSRSPFAEGMPMSTLREAAALVAGVEGERGTLRIAPPLIYSPLASWVITQSEAGSAWGWLVWKAGPAWAETIREAAYARFTRLRTGGYRLEPDTETLAALRVRYFLLPRGQVVLREPWRPIGHAGPYTLWRQPDAAPMASGVREPQREEEAFPVAWSQPAPDRMRLEFDAGPEPGWVRVNASPHPWWRAQGVGAERPVRALGAGMVVGVGPGPQRIEMHFEPPLALDLAEMLSAVAWIALGGWLLFRRLPGRGTGSSIDSG